MSSDLGSVSVDNSFVGLTGFMSGSCGITVYLGIFSVLFDLISKNASRDVSRDCLVEVSFMSYCDELVCLMLSASDVFVCDVTDSIVDLEGFVSEVIVCK